MDLVILDIVIGHHVSRGVRQVTRLCVSGRNACNFFRQKNFYYFEYFSYLPIAKEILLCYKEKK